jgi:hypothetical protein
MASISYPEPNLFDDPAALRRRLLEWADDWRSYDDFAWLAKLDVERVCAAAKAREWHSWNTPISSLREFL